MVVKYNGRYTFLELSDNKVEEGKKKKDFIYIQILNWETNNDLTKHWPIVFFCIILNNLMEK